MKELTCSFCGRSSKEVGMIPGPDANICVDCVRHANEMVTRHEKKAKDVPLRAAACIELTPEKGKMLYDLLYELLDNQKKVGSK